MSFTVCGICQKSPRMNDGGSAMRLHPDDLAGETIAPGAYQCCQECVDKFAPRIEARLRKTPELDQHGKPLTSDDGAPVMVLKPTQAITKQYLL
jgi:hypothetical protein